MEKILQSYIFLLSICREEEKLSKSLIKRLDSRGRIINVKNPLKIALFITYF